MPITQVTYIGSDTTYFLTGVIQTVLGWVYISGVLNAVMIDKFNHLNLSGNILDTSLWTFSASSTVEDSITLLPISR